MQNEIVQSEFRTKFRIVFFHEGAPFTIGFTAAGTEMFCHDALISHLQLFTHDSLGIYVDFNGLHDVVTVVITFDKIHYPSVHWNLPVFG